ncbi:hypothetical protein CYMTET_19961 [Cymbomonas tetramitiformis]|uniref:Uncharacterized protein n=1 Tax=Cymbomonas tetramitiformis TaxID=36881 RepID=A0AAE0G510_9CHLO|nr:hypothetical protein CYMTET_19961 [Cymbomonas tetramitiformis]
MRRGWDTILCHHCSTARYHDGVIRLQYSAEEQQFQRNLAFIVKPKENERPTTVMSTCVTMLPTTLL